MKDPRRHGLVPRFAFTTLCVFVAVAFSLWWVLTAIIRERTESTAQEHAEFVTHSVIQPALSKIDLHGPVPLGDRRYEEVRELVVSDVLGVQFPVVRVNVWGPDGTIWSQTNRASWGGGSPSPSGFGRHSAGRSSRCSRIRTAPRTSSRVFS